MNHDDDTERLDNEPVPIGGALHDVEGRVRLALDTDAHSIRPTERLDAILTTARSDVPLRFLEEPERRRPWLVAGAAAAAAAVVIGTLWVAGGSEAPTPALPTTATTSTGVSTPPGAPSSTSGTPEPSPSTSEPSSTTRPAAQLGNVPVYWVGGTGGKIKLFREFRTVPDEGGLVLSALYAMTREQPLDPDYMTPWSPASRIKVSTRGAAMTVDLDQDALYATSFARSPALARLAVQQLVYTATAAAAQGGTPVTTVTILVDGKSLDLWDSGVVVGTPTARASALDVQSQVWVLSPVHGERVDAGRVDVKAYGTSFEATFHAVLRNTSTGAVLDERAVQGGSNGEFREFGFSYTLAPGTYTLELSTDDPSGGAEGNGPDIDTKTFVVE